MKKTFALLVLTTFLLTGCYKENMGPGGSGGTLGHFKMYDGDHQVTPGGTSFRPATFRLNGSSGEKAYSYDIVVTDMEGRHIRTTDALYDDGQVNDKVAGDGIYEGGCTMPRLPNGAYYFLVRSPESSLESNKVMVRFTR